AVLGALARIIFAARRSLKQAITRSRGAHVRDRQEARDRFAQPDPRIGTRGGDSLHALFVPRIRLYPYTHRLLAARSGYRIPHACAARRRDDSPSRGLSVARDWPVARQSSA